MGGQYGNKRAIAPEREQEVIELYQREHCTRVVADVFGVSDETIRRILKRNGIPRRKPKREKPKAENPNNKPKGIDREQVKELFQAGLSISAIARQLGCTDNTVYHHLEKLGLYKVGQRKAENNALIPQILELHHQGMSDYEIAAVVGISSSTVNDRLRKAGIHRGKCYGMRDGYLKSVRKKAIARFESIADRFELLDYTDYEHALVRCKMCGTEFNWRSDTWEAKEPCPECRAVRLRAESERKQYEREQQREAAREWRLSVPHICKECGEPFYSEYNEPAYCCYMCKRHAKNKRKKLRGVGAGSYRKRMRIPRTPATYDRTVTLGAVYKKYGGRCCQCGCMTYRTKGYTPNQATLDHKIALANNGTHTWDNVQLLCSDCNSMKRDIGQMRLPIAV